ncbi:MAG: hypothetical protein KIG23_05540, partial [Erysipelotrichaceae bacterium]|nr:hypothetical protein [Erysipelotrichaceae bacterium]
INVNDLKIREEKGYSDNAPKWAYAYKIKP